MVPIFVRSSFVCSLFFSTSFVFSLFFSCRSFERRSCFHILFVDKILNVNNYYFFFRCGTALSWACVCVCVFCFIFIRWFRSVIIRLRLVCSHCNMVNVTNRLEDLAYYTSISSSKNPFIESLSPSCPLSLAQSIDLSAVLKFCLCICCLCLSISTPPTLLCLFLYTYLCVSIQIRFVVNSNKFQFVFLIQSTYICVCTLQMNRFNSKFRWLELYYTHIKQICNSTDCELPRFASSESLIFILFLVSSIGRFDCNRLVISLFLLFGQM